MVKFVCVFISFIFIAKATPETLPKRNNKSIPVVDALIHRLESEEWADDEETCFGATLRILNGVKNDTLWATWIWDSMQPPFGVFYGSGISLGNFDQCITTPWPLELSTQYCLVEVKVQKPKETKEFEAFDSADDYLNTLSIHGRTFNHLVLGVCMPGVCSPSSVAKFSRHLLQVTHIPDAEEIIVSSGDCQVGDQKPYPPKFYAFLSVFGALVSMVIVATIYTNYNLTYKESSIIDGIAKSFSMTHNWTDLFKVNKNEIRILNGIKVIMAIFVVGCHQYLLSMVAPSLLINSLEIDTMWKHELSGLNHLDLVVDTFFPISGLLLFRGLMGGRQKNLLLVLLKRYFRLIGPYVAATLYYVCMVQYTGTGPLWLRANANEVEICEKHWLKNFLMINYDFKTTCHGVTWYITCDYHLAILAVILFWIYRSSSKKGVMAFVAVSCGLTIQLAVMAYRKRLLLLPFSSPIEISSIRENDVMNDVYIRWHDRAGSYLVGVALGWFMSMYKPADHRNVISKTTSFTIVLLSLFIMMKVATINDWMSSGRVEVAIAIATNRVVWAMAVCALIAACEYGSAGFVRDFLGCSFFVPISKLSYGIYMTHLFIVQRNLHTLRTPLKFDMFNVIVCTLGSTVVACGAGLVLHILVEAPCINLTNLCLSERNGETELNTAKASNGSIRQNGTNGTTKFKLL